MNILPYIIPLVASFLDSGMTDYLAIVWALGALGAVIGLIKDIVVWGKQ